jgi:hypothetical protein
LVSLACSRLAERHLKSWWLHDSVNLLEEFADSRVSATVAAEEMRTWPHESFPTGSFCRMNAEGALAVALSGVGPSDIPYPWYVLIRTDDALTDGTPVAAARSAILVRLLHDIFGPLPFRDVAIAPEWLTSDVTALARGIYNDKAFDRMPILADALRTPVATTPRFCRIAAPRTGNTSAAAGYSIFCLAARGARRISPPRCRALPCRCSRS